ncbi:DUF945 domain-containing protein [Verminephrobacter aporrectodeae subsp. tuberculatae]|uniref:DUF945 domain-containing protein n=1 Tax=Verminephrobacter aporrectodeae subsp. tuberculatae TaxID=1110392 RepID=A0ABT3KZ59_9BURK|nr:DUF932 domain-containing protein [Verminephrobacter aporrectodeae]MCW5323631.1 DUF945 domain-containing protein [Verminephrobacter aporrectodeae subsp. tuberculatae]
MKLASRFRNISGIRADISLSDDQIRNVAPSIFAEAAHKSRSASYTYIPTIDVLNSLRKEGFQPFMVCQARVRNENKRDYTKHMIRLRHADQITGSEANEIILLNSHDGTSSYRMLAGMFRFVCSNGMVCGEMTNDIRVRHNGNVVGEVIEGAFKVLDSFEEATAQREAMRMLTVNQGEQSAFARAALALKYDEEDGAVPVTESQILAPRRFEDRRDDMWTTFNRVQENMMKGGLRGRSRAGRTTTTRPVNSIDQSVKLNRALWVLAEEMRRQKG